MSYLLDQLEKDTLPQRLVETFVGWCVWKQGRAALHMVLEKSGLYPMAQDFDALESLDDLITWSENVVTVIPQSRHRGDMLALSAVEAAAFEFKNLAKSSRQADWDPAAAAFFASRVCGWAGWAETGFGETQQKILSEHHARQEQEACLQALWQEFDTTRI